MMIDIDNHQIIDLIESRQESDVTKWLETYPNLRVISRNGGIMYKAASDKSHPKPKQIYDRFHILKNLTDYAKDALKRILKREINIADGKENKITSDIKKKYEYKT